MIYFRYFLMLNSDVHPESMTKAPRAEFERQRLRVHGAVKKDTQHKSEERAIKQRSSSHLKKRSKVSRKWTLFVSFLTSVCISGCAVGAGSTIQGDSGTNNSTSIAGSGSHAIDPNAGNSHSSGGSYDGEGSGSEEGLVCDEVTGKCSCISIGMLGRFPTYGAVPGQDDTAALQAWLNEKSTATVEVHTGYTSLTTDFLAQYDVIILQALEDREGGPYWNFSTSDIANLEQWVKEGGGVVSLTGYGAQPAEVDPVNRLLTFTGMSYNTDDILSACPSGCCYCVGNSIPVTGWNSAHLISSHITAIGAFHGRSINLAPDSATVVSQEGAVVGATLELDEGRVFMFADEWVSYTSQWTGEGVSTDCNVDPNHSCYGTSAQNLYQVPQFWYNAILWASGDKPCFLIDEPTIII